MKGIRLSKKTLAVICTFSVILFLCVSAIVALLVSFNYRSIYNTPNNNNAVMDLDGYNLKNASIDATTSGKWEFFYNKWIVADGLDNEKPDFFISVPSRWTGRSINGKRLSNKGYASYRFTLLNAEIGSELVLKLQIFPIAYRTFINGQLTCENGQLSKTAGGGISFGLPKLTPYSVTGDAPLIVVLEISYNSSGGLFLSPWLRDCSRAVPEVWSLLSLLPVFAAGMMVTFVFFILILNLGLSKKDKNLSFIFLMAALFFHLLTTRESFLKMGTIITRLGIGYGLVYELNFITAFLVMLFFLANIILQRSIVLSKRQFYTIMSVLFLCAVLFYAFYGFAYQIVPVILGMFIFCYIFYRILLTPQKRIRNKLFPAIILFVILFVFLLEMMDNLGYLVFGLEPGFSIMSFVILILISLSAFLKIRDVGADLIKAAVLEKEVQNVKHQALKAQIKPHFIFNVMSSIQALYRKDTTEGEDALTGFAAYLRQNIDADNHDLIPFSNEIKNIMNYVELENLRLDRKLTLILDIDFVEFEIPVLSLQPLIENAIKYAGTDKKEDGFIGLLSRLENEFIIIQVIDNGNGFALNNIRKNAAGLKNTSERLRYLTKAELMIESIIGKGTTITIKIPYNNETDKIVN